MKLNKRNPNERRQKPRVSLTKSRRALDLTHFEGDPGTCEFACGSCLICRSHDRLSIPQAPSGTNETSSPDTRL